MSELLLLGMSHKTASIAVRERIALGEDEAAELIERLLEPNTSIQELVAISTCNRTEFYMVSADPVAAESAVLSAVAERAGTRPTELLESIYSHRNCEAARHLFKVSGGLDSMVLGEAEVQGQVRRAYERSLKSGYTGPLTNRLFQAAVETGKRIRSETGIGSLKTSVASVAVELAHNAIGDLSKRNVVVLGAGETSEQVAQALASEGVGTIFVANRRRERAISLAERFDGQAIGFDRLPAELEQADIVLASTSSPHPIVEAEDLATVMRARSWRPLLMIDIAVPRDIEHACSSIEGVSLYDIDDLQSVVSRNRTVRKGEARQAEQIVEDEIKRFARWLGTLEVTPTVAALQQHGQQIVEQLLAENANRWEQLSERDAARVKVLAETVAKRVLAAPMTRIKQVEGDRRHSAMRTLTELFGLDETETHNQADVDDVAEVHELKQRRSS